MITPLRLSELAANYGWQLIGTDLEFDQVSTDSRTMPERSLFVALRGDRFDGHAFVVQAKNEGAAAALVSKKCRRDVPQLVCPDTLRGLAEVAKANVEKFDYPLIALTGSAGKTTTKTMLAHILGLQAPTLATQDNLNNEIGVPLTAIEIGSDHRFAVIEMGAAKKGDIAYLCRHVKPTVALITNAGDAHIEGFGSVQGIAEGKGEIYQALAAGDTAIINTDSPHQAYWKSLVAHADIITFGCASAADVSANDIQLGATSCRFNLRCNQSEHAVSLPMPGRHNVANALAAAAASAAVGVDSKSIAAALNSFEGVASRLSTLRGLHGATIINDSYNANPSAFKAAIDVLVGRQGQTIVVMGDMAELGDYCAQGHRDVGAYAKESGVDRLFAVGEYSQLAAKAFGTQAQWYATKTALNTALLAQLESNQTLLVKGSRSSGMETVVEKIVATPASEFPDQRGVPC